MVAVLLAVFLNAMQGHWGQTSGPTAAPYLTDQSGIYIVFSGPGARSVAGQFQASAARSGTYWSTFRQGPTDYQIACRLRYGQDSVEVVKSNAALEAGIEGSVCAAFVANGWHQ